MKVVVKDLEHSDGTTAEGHYLWCPGCDDVHMIAAGGDYRPIWQWDGDLDAPTYSPSILVGGAQWATDSTFHKPRHPGVPPGGSTVCHSFLRAGVWEFLGDSTHHLAGQSAPMVECPDWVSQ